MMGRYANIDHEVENSMTTDWWWDEQEYRIPSKARLKREKQAYEEAEREDREDDII